MTADSTRYLPASLILLIILSTLAIAATTGERAEGDERIHVDEWLLLGPVPAPLPAFHDEAEKKFTAAELLAYGASRIDTFFPADGKKMISIPGAAAWHTVQADTSGASLPADSITPAYAYLAAYIEVSRWTEATLEVRGTHPFECTVDGKSIVKCPAGGKGGELGDWKRGSAKLVRGKHLLVVKTVHVPGDTIAEWRLDAGVTSKDETSVPALSLSPIHILTLDDVLDTPSVRGIAVSPDGKLVAFTLRRFIPPGGETESWIEVRETRNGEPVRTIRDLEGGGNVQWAPREHRLSYTASHDGKNVIRVIDLDAGTAETIIDGIEIDYYRWAPDGSYIIYSVAEKPEKNESDVKRLKGIYDRPARDARTSSLYLSTVPGGATRRLTAGKYGAHLEDIHPDGRSILFMRYYEKLDARPYGVDELYLLRLNDQEPELLHRAGWLRGAAWSPDGDRILVRGGPSVFGDVGRNLPNGMIPNEYDVQIYLFDPETKEAESITRKFDPAVNRVFWSRADGSIYLTAEEGSFVHLYRCDPDGKSFTRIETGCDVVRGIDVAREAPIAVVSGSSADHPQRLYTVNLKRRSARQIFDPTAERFTHVRPAKVEDFDFTTDEGKTIQGRIHYPPGFDPSSSYPCIVYYYGGTSPVSRDFGGRYPKNLWAAMGYVVYVLQPSGATGYGQEFSAFHVNDWGKVVANEIIEGVGRFLEAHPFVDPARVGCIGASYGGFMTQLLLTQTDIFAAAVSHAGISSITSYWGEGYWGYAYNAVAAANSFPWNRPDIYIEQSPLFYADRINTPLLLLHGESDTNVPPGESEQMYTALKLLGKDVEYIRFGGQNHFILDYKKRRIWSNAIVAWFDRWLKDEPAWWRSMYPPLDGEKKGGAEDIGLQIIEREDKDPILMGRVTREEIVQHIHTWDIDYYEYLPDEAVMIELEPHVFDVDITIVFGTWCSDSRTQVPRFWRILEDLDYPVDEITMLAVGSSRFTTDMGISSEVLAWSDSVKKHHGVERVATFIISKGGVELGRIVETPQESLEKDLLRILTGSE